jgi:hypothetical protein
MKRSRIPRRAKQTPDTEALVRLATGYSLSATRIEDAFWDVRLVALVNRLIDEGAEEVFNAALDQLYLANGRAYDELADTIESCTESRRGPSASSELLLFVTPLLAWSRYVIPSGPVSATVTANARVQLQAHVFASNVKIGLANYLFSPDQLPQGFCETAVLREKLAKAALHDRDLALDGSQFPETNAFLSDTRFLIGVAVAPKDAALFRWQEDDGNRDDALAQWRTQGGEALRPLFTGCAYELLLPQPFHAGCREADRQARPYSLSASAAFLATTLNIPPAKLRAVVAPFFDHRLEEYRIGFTQLGDDQVIHGVVWPLLDSEDENADIGPQIEAVLKETGVGEVMLLDHRFPLEWCDDCGAPLFPNPEGEPAHAEMPEEQGEPMPRHLH